MAHQMATKPDIDYFRDLEPGTEQRFYLPDQHVPSFVWGHDRVERDIVYGSIQFEGIPEQFPVHGYLHSNGRCVAMSCHTCKTEAATDGQANLPGGSPIYLSPPLPSQFPVRGGATPDIRTTKISGPELAAMDQFQRQATGYGFRFRDSHGLQIQDSNALWCISDSYRSRDQKGCIDFDVSKNEIKGHISIRKIKSGGAFSKPVWILSVLDASNRDVQPSGWGKDGIMISPGSTALCDQYRVYSMASVLDALLSSLDELVARNR